jgi:hypothetical protein
MRGPMVSRVRGNDGFRGNDGKAYVAGACDGDFYVVCHVFF